MKHLESALFSAVSGNHRKPETVRLRPFFYNRFSPHIAAPSTTDPYNLIFQRVTEVAVGTKSLHLLNRFVADFLFDTKDPGRLISNGPDCLFKLFIKKEGFDYDNAN